MRTEPKSCNDCPHFRCEVSEFTGLDYVRCALAPEEESLLHENKKRPDWCPLTGEESEEQMECKRTGGGLTDRKERILSLSYGKDSLACLGAIQELGWPLDRIIHVEVFATETIPAELPPMVEFKARADDIIEKMTGIRVERIRAKETYESVFYRTYKKGQWEGKIYGFPIIRGAWCNSILKCGPLEKVNRRGIAYIGIAADEPNRFHNITPTKLSPLIDAGWTEAMCREWCEAHDLLSPIYQNVTRGGCWFCHNQGIEQLRQLRRNYPEYWSLLLKWDNDTPRTFKANGHSVHDYDRRFSMEDAGLLKPNDRAFKWNQVIEG